MENILLTGAFGNIGLSTIDELLIRGFNITAFDLPRKKNFRKYRRLKKVWADKISVIWGDLRNYEDVERAMENMKNVIHLGALIPPLSENSPDLAYDVNVEGTKNVIKAIKMVSPSTHLIYTSSFAIFGNREENPIISLEDSFNPMSHYARYKLECEKLIQSSKIRWTILRLTYVPSLNDLRLYRFMYDVPLNIKIELTTSKDVALALVNSIDNSQVLYKIFNVAGGTSCRTTYGEYLMNMLEIFGLGADSIPAEAFSKEGTFGGWIKPQGSQEALRYQQTSLDEFYQNLRRKYRIIHYIVKIVRPIAKRIIIRKSHYIQEVNSYHTIAEYLNLIDKNPFKLEDGENKSLDTYEEPIHESLI